MSTSLLGEVCQPLPCRHHEDRVKKLITEPGNPNLIISAAEDSTGEPPAVSPSRSFLKIVCHKLGLREAHKLTYLN